MIACPCTFKLYTYIILGILTKPAEIQKSYMTSTMTYFVTATQSS